MKGRFYNSVAWRRLRAACLERHPICATAGCGQRSVVADHIIPRSQGGADTLENLIGRCITCHNARRGTAEPRLRGCDADGIPRDRKHSWNITARENLSQLRRRTAWGDDFPVSSPPRYRGRR